MKVTGVIAAPPCLAQIGRRRGRSLNAGNLSDGEG